MKPVRILLSAVLATAMLMATALGSVVQADLTALTTSGSALVGLTASGDLVRSTDGGASFTTTRADGSVDLYNVVASGTTVLAFGDSGFIVRSTDGGQTWTELTTVEAPSLTGQLRDGATSNGTFWVAVGQSGVNLALEWSTDGGATWAAATSVPTVSGRLNAVCFDASSGRWTAVGATGLNAAILTSTDGKNWTSVTAPTEASALNDVATDGSGNLLAVGEAGTLITSSNGGVSFTADANSGMVSEALNAVVYTSSGWTAGGDDLVQVSFTVGGGAVVSQQPIPGAGDITALAVDSGGQVAVSGGGFASVATVSLGSLSATYDGSAKSATATTSPSGLTVTFTYNGSSTAPTNAGSYTVVGTAVGRVESTDYTGGATGTLVIAKANQSITFDPLSDVTTQSSPITLSATATSGQPVTFNVESGPATVSGTNGTTLTLTGAGTVVVRASQGGNGNYNAATPVDRSFAVTTFTGTPATVTLGSLSATYDGSAKSATATTDPTGLTVTFTYDGSSTAPTNAGSYAVVGTISDATYAGSATGTLVIAKATQTINFADPADRAYSTSPIALSATSTSGLGVTFAVASGPATISGSSLTLTGAGTVVVDASQAGNANYDAARTVSQSFVVSGNFESWRAEHFSAEELSNTAISGPNAILAGDGYSNLLRYALGLDPVEAVGARAPVSSATETQWLFTYTRPSAITDITYTVQASTDMVDWTSIVITPALMSSSDGMEEWQASYARSSAARLFFRLKVAR